MIRFEPTTFSGWPSSRGEAVAQIKASPGDLLGSEDRALHRGDGYVYAWFILECFGPVGINWEIHELNPDLAYADLYVDEAASSEAVCRPVLSEKLHELGVLRERIEWFYDYNR